jgi:hypothetical protein
LKFLKYTISFFILLIFLTLIYKPLTFKSSSSLSHLQELIGAIHIHSNLSDGRLSPEKIAEDARKSGLDFVILTDHGNPNLEVIEREGIIKGVAIISGSEISLFDGTLLAIGIEKPSYKISPVIEEAIDDIKELGGVSIVPHPERNKEKISEFYLKGVNGTEIIDLDDEIRKKSFFRIFKALLIFPINSRFSLLTLVDNPEDEIRKWDEGLKIGKIWGLYGLNVHGRVWIFPFSYTKIFNLMRIHIPIENRKPNNFIDLKRVIIKSLMNGKFFSSIDGAGDSRGFRFYLSKREKRIEMGEDGEPGSYLHLELPYKTNFQAIILRNGKVFSSTNSKNFQIKVDKEGIYRVEVYLLNNPALNRNVPWILSNPIFVGVKKNLWVKEERWKKVPLFDFKELVPENDQSSEGKIEISESFLSWNYKLGFSSSSRPHVWCALAVRKNFSFEGFRGIGIEAKGLPQARVWVQIRDKVDKGERWWSASLKVKEEYREKLFQWDDFKLVKGEGGKLDLKKVEGIFLIIDKGSMGEGTRGNIKIRSIFAIK